MSFESPNGPVPQFTPSTVDLDSAVMEDLFSWEGAVALGWEVASRCSCYSDDSKQPEWGHEPCKGLGVIYAPRVEIKGLFRSQDRWLSFRREGELERGEAQLTTPLDIRPGYIDRRVRDRIITLSAVGDAEEGRVFYPAAQAKPFIFGNVQRAWRVSLQSASEADQLVNYGV
jgi:hypothetical protein